MKKIEVLLLGVSLMVSLPVSEGGATSVPVGNASFETEGTSASGAQWFSLPDPGDWVDGAAPGAIYDILDIAAFNAHFPSGNAPGGNNVLNLGSSSPLSQSLSYDVTYGDLVTLQFYIGNSADQTDPPGDVTVTLTLDGMGAYSTTVVNDSSDDSWRAKTVFWTATNSGSLGVQFACTDNAWIDDVSVDVLTPGTQEYFVATSGSDSNSGLNWGQAFATISNAVAQADAGIITVSNGTYHITAAININKPLQIRSFGDGQYGGLVNAAATIVDGPGGSDSGPRIFELSSVGIVLDGLTVRDGCGRGDAGFNGNGIYIASGGVQVNNCIIEDNGGTIGYDYCRGGGIYMVAGVVSNCIVRNNITRYRGGGGGIYATGGTVTHCVVSENTNDGGWEHGGGVYLGAAASLINTLVTKNGAYATHGTPMGGGLYLDGGQVLNCTVGDNRSDAGAGGVYIASGSVINSIVYSNTVAGVHNNLNTMSGVSYSCAVNVGSTTNDNVQTDPQFVDIAAGNYRLLKTSPCINAGNASVVTWVPDLDGNPRVTGSKVDMGIYETASPGTLLIVR